MALLLARGLQARCIKPCQPLSALLQAAGVCSTAQTAFGQSLDAGNTCEQQAIGADLPADCGPSCQVASQGSVSSPSIPSARSWGVGHVASSQLQTCARRFGQPSRHFAKDAFASDQAQDAPASKQDIEEVSNQDFHRFADVTMGVLLDRIETYLDEIPDLDGGDVEYGQGVLTVHLGKDKGTFVVNKQGPNKQIWLSSPVSGPFRYDHAAGGRWVYRHDGHDLTDRLAREIEQLCGRPIDLEPDDQGAYGPDPT